MAGRDQVTADPSSDDIRAHRSTKQSIDDDNEDHRRKESSRGDKRKRRRREDDSDDENRRRRRQRRRDDDSDDSEQDRKRSRKRKKSSKKKKKRQRREYSSEESDESSEPTTERTLSSKKVVNARLVEKLAARGETLEEREERRAQRRAARMTAKFGYTPDENPFNDPNLHEAFTWKKKDLSRGDDQKSRQKKQEEIFEEIEKVRNRRRDRELQFEEMERIRAEESRMRELENYDEWARKEEEFHLLQQRQRSAIRLVEGREKPIDVLAKNMLMFGLTEDEMTSRATVKYQERYNALNELENLEAELEEPHAFLRVLKLNELEDLLMEMKNFRKLEKESTSGFVNSDSPVLRYWDNLILVGSDEIKFLKDGGSTGPRAATIEDIKKLFNGQSRAELVKMKDEVERKVRKSAHAEAFGTADGNHDTDYWRTVLEQLDVHFAKVDLSELHNKMLARQLERLEKKKVELETQPKHDDTPVSGEAEQADAEEEHAKSPPRKVDGFENLEEELGLADEFQLSETTYNWKDKFRPRKPRYFNRVKTGYDWNKYNQTHYDHDNPPPKTVQGYKFNIFYPDLIDRTKTPQYFLERADSDEFCIIRFHGGPPYEDIAFKIINREWARSRKKGFRCTFERGVLSLYFNFTTHWYRR